VSGDRYLGSGGTDRRENLHDGRSQGDHLPGKPGNVREFDSCQGNVRDFTKNYGMSAKDLVREKLSKTVYYKLHICIHTGI